MKITYLTEEHLDFLASEGYARMDDDEKETWDIEAAQAVAHDPPDRQLGNRPRAYLRLHQRAHRAGRGRIIRALPGAFKSNEEEHTMPKTRFIRKACTLDEVRERTQWLERYCGEQPLDRYYVAKEIQLQENDFFELCDNLLVDRD